jgi:hypothetical protein
MQLESAALQERLTRYFVGLPHPWFAPQEEALAHIDASYRRNAARLDVSPRATISARDVPDPALFKQMLAADLPWMMRFSELALRARLVLLCSTASRRHYLIEFVRKHLPSATGHLEGPRARPAGHGKIWRHELVLGARRLPVWSCSTSHRDQERGTARTQMGLSGLSCTLPTGLRGERSVSSRRQLDTMVATVAISSTIAKSSPAHRRAPSMNGSQVPGRGGCSKRSGRKASGSGQ